VEGEGEGVMSSVSGFSNLVSRAEEKVRGLQRDYWESGGFGGEGLRRTERRLSRVVEKRGLSDFLQS